MAQAKHWADPRNLIREAYRIEGITAPDCRSIFLDWALGSQSAEEVRPMIVALLETYGPDNPDHPMTVVLREGLERAERTGRRGGWAARRGRSRKPPGS